MALLGMFLLTQFIGLAVIHAYSPIQKQVINETTGMLENISVSPLPEGFQPPEEITPMEFLPLIITLFIFAILIMLILMKFGLNRILKFWFFIVVIIAVALTLNAVLNKFPALNSYLIPENLTYSFFISLLIAVPLAVYKIFKRNILIHNLTELMIYPGLAAVLAPLFNVVGIIIILIIISIYDAWAVWHSKIMIKMAKFQMNKLKIFAGLLVPYIGKKESEQLQLVKSKYKTQKSQERILKKKNIKISLAILGGGDIVFPIIAAGVMLRAFGIIPALFITFGSLLGLGVLFLFSEKKKFYPAMPFITAGIFLGMILWRVLLF